MYACDAGYVSCFCMLCTHVRVVCVSLFLYVRMNVMYVRYVCTLRTYVMYASLRFMCVTSVCCV